MYFSYLSNYVFANWRSNQYWGHLPWMSIRWTYLHPSVRRSVCLFVLIFIFLKVELSRHAELFHMAWPSEVHIHSALPGWLYSSTSLFRFSILCVSGAHIATTNRAYFPESAFATYSPVSLLKLLGSYLCVTFRYKKDFFVNSIGSVLVIFASALNSRLELSYLAFDYMWILIK